MNWTPASREQRGFHATLARTLPSRVVLHSSGSCLQLPSLARSASVLKDPANPAPKSSTRQIKQIMRGLPPFFDGAAMLPTNRWLVFQQKPEFGLQQDIHHQPNLMH